MKYGIGQLVNIKGFVCAALRITAIISIQTEEGTVTKYVGRLWNWWDRDGERKTNTDSNKVIEVFACELGEVLNEL